MGEFTYSLPFKPEQYLSYVINALKQKGHTQWANLLEGSKVEFDDRGLSYYYNNVGRWDAHALVILFYISIDKMGEIERFPKDVLQQISDNLIPSNVGYDLKSIEYMPDFQNIQPNECEEVTLPIKEEETLRTLLNDINCALKRNQPILVLDRLHTYSTKLIRQLCDEHKIKTNAPNGDYLPLHSLVGMLVKYYEQNKLCQSDFTLRAFKSSISLFEAYNSIRNNKSYAHDNEVLDNIEAIYVVREITNLITFLDKFEHLITTSANSFQTNNNDEFNF